MQRLSGHLWELVVAYQNRTTGGLFQEDVWTYLLYGIIYCMQFLSYDIVV